MRGLPGAYKLFWDFLYHDCDHSGIWIVDIDIAQTYIGKDMVISEKVALEFFNDEEEERIVVLPGGKKWFIPSFIEFQYGHLSEKNKAHNSTILTLKKLNLIDKDLKIVKTLKPPSSPLQGAKEMVKEKEMEMDKEKEQDPPSELLAPQMVQAFKSVYPKYPEDRDSDYPACVQIALKIAKSNGWLKEAVTNGKLDETVEIWKGIVRFSSSDSWLSTRSISDFNKEYQRIIQKMNNDGTTKKHSPGRTIIQDKL